MGLGFWIGKNQILRQQKQFQNMCTLMCLMQIIAFGENNQCVSLRPSAGGIIKYKKTTFINPLDGKSFWNSKKNSKFLGQC